MTKMVFKKASTLAFGLLALFIALPAMAQEMKFDGAAHPLGFQTANGPLAEYIYDTYDFIFWITAVIFIVVQAVLLYAVFKFRQSNKRKPEHAKKFSHHTALEVVWTVVPVLITLAIGWKSYEGLYYVKTMPEKGMNVEAIAYQFGWDFAYPELGIEADPETKHEQLSSAGVDRYIKEMVIPQNAVIKMNITATDVLHAFYLPAMGVKVDAIPGRVNYRWFEATKTGEYIGQCAELCGAAHGEMFFTVKVLPQDEWRQWVNDKRKAVGLEPLSSPKMAALLEGKSVQ